MRRRQRAAQRGQTLIIFALTLTTLLGFAGLVIDLGQAYDLLTRMQRAAEAGALAGALYMPNYFNTVRPGDVDSAVSRASKEMVKNGFGTLLAPTASACASPPTSVEISICPSVSGKVTDLQVTITEQYSVVLLGGLGVTPISLSTSAQAEYVTPIELGSATSFMGDQMDCSPGNALSSNSSPCALNDTTTNHLQNFVVSMNGPAELKEQGDAFVYCAEGPAEPDSTVSNFPFVNSQDPDPGGLTNVHPYFTYNGYPTDHPQWSDILGSAASQTPITNHCGAPGSGSNTGNPDQQPSGYDGPATDGSAHPGGYNFLLNVSSGVSAASLWVYNPSYIPQDANLTPQPMDYFLDGGLTCGNGGNKLCAPVYYQGPNGEGISNLFDGIHRDAPLFYFTTTFSLYSVSSLFDRSSDGIPMVSIAYPPYDATSADLNLHQCAPGQVYNPQWSGSNTPNFYHNPSGNLQTPNGCTTPVATQQCWLAWCKISPPGGLGPGYYRLAVEATGLTARAFNILGKKDYLSGPTDGYGSHAFAVKMCDSDSVTQPNGSAGCRDGTGLGSGQYQRPDVSVASWNNVDVTFQGALGTRMPNKNYPQTACVNSNVTPYACLDLACIPTEFAGRAVGVSFFALGQNTATSSKNLSATPGGLFVGVEPPVGGGSVTYPAAVQSSLQLIDGVQAVKVATGPYAPYNGLWFDVILTLPPNYQGDCPLSPSNTGLSGVWQLMYASNDNYQTNDKVTFRFTLVGSPMHLVTPG